MLFLKYVWEVWVTNKFVCYFLSLSDQMCVALASTHTAVQAGRLYQEGTSVSFVSYSLILLRRSTESKRKRQHKQTQLKPLHSHLLLSSNL